MGKRPSFVETAVDRMQFLCDDYGFRGPQIQSPWNRIPNVAHVRYHSDDYVIDVIHVVGYMGENYVETRWHRKGVHSAHESDWVSLGSNTTHSGYQLRRALDLQAHAVRTHLSSK